MPIDGPLMAIDGPHGTAMAIDELRWDLTTGYKHLLICAKFVGASHQKAEKVDLEHAG